MKSKNTKGFAMILAGILIAIVAVGGFVAYNASKNPTPEIVLQESDVEFINHSDNFEGSETVMPSNEEEEACENYGSTHYINNDHGFSFCLPESFDSVNLSVNNGDEGKQLYGYTQDPYSQTDIRIGGVTPVFVAPIESDAYMWKEYPTQAQLQNLSDQGYQNLESVNSNGENYAVIYGQPESGMPFIGQGQVVVVFKLESSQDFNTVGFMLVNGDLQTFMTMIDSVQVN